MTPTLLSDSTLDAPVEGRNIHPGSLRDQLGSRPTLLVFLRHLGCPFCREWLSDLRDAGKSDSTLPSRLFFHLGTPEQGNAFFSSFAPETRAIADPKLLFYEALGVPKAPKLQFLDPRVWACGLRALGKGLVPAKPVGDPLVMPALFLVEGNQIVWKFIPSHLGGLPRIADLPRSLVV